MPQNLLASSLKFNSQTYSAASCIQSLQYNYSVDGHDYQCDGYVKVVAGAKNISVSFSLVLERTDTVIIAALVPGTNAADFELHIWGDTATYLEIASSDATLMSRNGGGSANGIAVWDCEFRLNQVTEGAAS
jgi:hypothetical protein